MYKAAGSPYTKHKVKCRGIILATAEVILILKRHIPHNTLQTLHMHKSRVEGECNMCGWHVGA